MTRTLLARRPWLAFTVAIAMSAVFVTSADAQPSSDEARTTLQRAQERLDELSDEFNGIVDDYNEAQEQLEEAQEKVAEADQDLQRLKGEFDQLSGAASAHVRQIHMMGPSVEIATMFAATDASAATEMTAVLRRVLTSQQSDMQSLSAVRLALEAAEARLIEDRDQAQVVAAEVAEKQARIEQTIEEQEQEVEEHEATLAAAISREEAERRAAEEAARQAAAERARQQRAAEQAAAQRTAATSSSSAASSSNSSNSTSTDATPPPASSTPAPRAGAQAAVDAALSRVGMPYRWGATGPNAFDCSGLMVWAWAQAGVSLPRTSASQHSGIRSISRSELQPGDLIFAGSPRVHHVGMYIGNGQIVHAPRAGRPVEIRSMERSDIRGYGRPG